MKGIKWELKTEKLLVVNEERKLGLLSRQVVFLFVFFLDSIFLFTASLHKVNVYTNHVIETPEIYFYSFQSVQTLSYVLALALFEHILMFNRELALLPHNKKFLGSIPGWVGAFH